MANTIQEKLTQTGMKRRTVIKGAAWSVPVIAAAVATPLAAASGEPPKDATAYGTAGSTKPGGSPAFFDAYGQDDDGNDAKIPANTVITFSVSPETAAGTVALTTANATLTGPVNGVYTITPVTGTLRVRLKATFPAGTSATIAITGPLGSSSSNGNWS